VIKRHVAYGRRRGPDQEKLMRLTSTGLALLAGTVAAFAAVSVASAHAHYKSSAPAKGEVLAAAPSQAAVVFTQAIQKVAGTYSVSVENAGGVSVTTGPAIVAENDRTRMSAPLQAGLAAGRYVVHWTNVSDDDSDPGEGAFSFYVQKQPSADDLASDQQLESIGAEPETTAAADTPAAGGTASSATAAAPTRISVTPAAASKSSDGGNGNTTLYVVIGVIVAAAVLAAGGFAYARRGGARR
jgi:methionine-rich copper-binding protein CopC